MCEIYHARQIFFHIPLSYLIHRWVYFGIARVQANKKKNIYILRDKDEKRREKEKMLEAAGGEVGRQGRQ